MAVKQEWNYWRSWEFAPRVFLYILWFLGLALGLVFFYGYFMDISFIQEWKLVPNLDSFKVYLDKPHWGTFEIPIEAESFVLDQSYSSGGMRLPSFWSYAFGLFALLFWACYLAVISQGNRWVYTMGMGMFLFYIALGNPDYMGQFFSYSQGMTAILIGFYGLSSYLMYHYMPRGRLWLRIVFWLVALWGTGWVLQSMSPLQHPWLYFIHFSSVILIFLIFAFILQSSHELVLFFFYLSVRGGEEKGSGKIRNFLIISAIYIVNIFLLYLDRTSTTRWGLLYLDAYVCLALSGILGIWGFRKRNERFENYFPFRPWGGILYALWMVQVWATLLYLQFSGNDSLLNTFYDFILYSYLAFGFIFFLYILGNFAPMLVEQLPVWPLVYEGKFFPWKFVRYFAVVVLIALVAQNQRFLYYQGVAGYHIVLGDAYYYNGDIRLAKINYQLGVSNDFLSHRANYALASIARIDEDEGEVLISLQRARRRNPQDYTYIEYAEILQGLDKPFEALFCLSEGQEKLPRSAPLLINLAQHYQRYTIPDSVFFYLEQVEGNIQENRVVEANMQSFLARTLSLKASDSLDIPLLDTKNFPTLINQLALFTGLNKLYPGEVSSLTRLSPPNLPEMFALAYNLGLNHKEDPDTNIQLYLNKVEELDSLGKFRRRTSFARAVHLYYSGKVHEGIQSLIASPFLSRDPYFNTILGLWLMEQKAFESALFYFRQAGKLGNVLSNYYQAICWSEFGQIPEAYPAWEGVLNSTDTTESLKTVARTMLRVLGEEIKIEDEADVYNFMRYRGQNLDADTRATFWSKLEGPNYALRTAVLMSQYALDEDNVPLAREMLDKTEKLLSLASPTAQQEWQIAQLRVLGFEQKPDDILSKIKVYTDLTIKQTRFYEALAYYQKGDKKQAEKLYQEALEWHPYDEEIVRNVVAFYELEGQNPKRVYEILLRAVRANQKSPALWKAYALASLKMGLDYYGEEALAVLANLMEPAALASFQKEYEALQKAQLEQKPN